MTTVHANTPRDALSRLETMVLMAGYDLPIRAIREQIVSALHLIVQVDRMPDGRRVVTAVTEVQGLEGDVVLLQDIFHYRMMLSEGSKSSGALVATGLRPKLVDRLEASGIEVPAKVFRPPTPLPLQESRGRRTRMPTASELAEPERAR